MPTAPTGGQFMPPGMPFMPPVAPTAPLVPPSPTDYTQQLFGYLQAWRQYLEQMAGARPATPQPSTANPSGNGSATSSAGATSPAASPVVQRPPVTSTGTTGPSPVDSELVGSVGDSFASRSAKLPPFDVLAPGTEAGSQLPDDTAIGLDAGLRRNPSPPGRFGGPVPPAVYRPPIYDYGNFFDRTRYRSNDRADTASATGAPAPRAPAGLAQRPVGSTFRGAMARVRPDASPPVQPPSLFRNLGQTP
jgi:hypothetical protein